MERRTELIVEQPSPTHILKLHGIWITHLKSSLNGSALAAVVRSESSSNVSRRLGNISVKQKMQEVCRYFQRYKEVMRSYHCKYFYHPYFSSFRLQRDP